MNNENIVEFKGTKKGIIINVKENKEIEEIKSCILEKIESANGFFNGAKIASIKGDNITDVQILQIKDFLENELKFSMVEEDEEVNETQKTIDDVFQGIKEGNTKFIKTTLRSGARVEYPGNIIIIGDVNPGAQVIAHGNIVIIGALRGVVHAGCNGNKNSFVTAYKLDPMQLRIADKIAISPEESDYVPNSPEIAFIKENEIIIENYLKNIHILED